MPITTTSSNDPVASADASAFHAGEQAVQARAGSKERMAQIGPRVIRRAMPVQHREFFPLLPFVVLGVVDAAGRPWATLLEGAGPGFVSSPDERHLRIAALPPAGDPVRPLLRDGASLGLLGIELPTRRRNRANGVVVGRNDGGFGLHVVQSFGNCPKYIQRRDVVPSAVHVSRGEARRIDRLDAPAAALVEAADTFFIASHAPGAEPNTGSDVSHRGGRPGFVRVGDDGRTLTWPDYTGNAFFNTLGNLALEPRAGLVFPDFETGGLLHVAGRAEIVWDGPELPWYPGAERLVRLHVEEALWRPGVLRLRWRVIDGSSAPEVPRQA